MKTTVYLVRHGDVHNPGKVFYGRLPGFRLSDLGRMQAHTLGRYLGDKRIDAIYASPLERTHETATIVASYHKKSPPIQHDDRLLEVYSVTQGRKIAELEALRWNLYLPKYTKLGSEKLSDIWSRMGSVIRELVKKHQGQEIVLVSHGDPIMVSMIKHKNRPLRLAEIRGEEYVQTAQGFRFVFEEQRVIEVVKLGL